MIEFASQIFSRVTRTGVFWALLGPLVRTIGFLVVISLALRLLNASDIGLWYVLVNISMLGSSIEMGFSYTISRFASYFMAGQQDVRKVGMGIQATSGSPPNYRGLNGLIVTAKPLYFRFALFSAFNILVVGGLWLALSDPPKLQNNLQTIAFLVLGGGTAINVVGIFWHHMLLGVNRVRAYHVLTTTGLLAGYAVSLLGLLAGGGILAMATGMVVMNALPRFWSRRMMQSMIPSAEPQSVPVGILWPMTWRTGTTTFATYLMLPFSTVIAAEVAGMEAAGSYGLCMQIGLLIHLFSGSWLSVKAPLIAQLQSQGNIRAIRSITRNRMMLGLATYVAGSAIALWLAPVLLEFVGSRTPPLPTGQLAILFLVIGMDFIVGMHTVIIQTANHIPYLRPYLFSAIITPMLALLLGELYGLWGVIIAPALVQAAWNYWWTPRFLWRYLKQQEQSIAHQHEAIRFS